MVLEQVVQASAQGEATRGSSAPLSMEEPLTPKARSVSLKATAVGCRSDWSERLPMRLGWDPVDWVCPTAAAVGTKTWGGASMIFARTEQRRSARTVRRADSAVS